MLCYFAVRVVVNCSKKVITQISSMQAYLKSTRNELVLFPFIFLAKPRK